MKNFLFLASFLAFSSQQASLAVDTPKTATPTSKPTAWWPSAPCDPRSAVEPAVPPVIISFHEENDLILFHYAWSLEANAVPQLADRFCKDIEKTKADLITAVKTKAFRAAAIAEHRRLAREQATPSVQGRSW